MTTRRDALTKSRRIRQYAEQIMRFDEKGNLTDSLKCRWKIEPAIEQRRGLLIQWQVWEGMQIVFVAKERIDCYRWVLKKSILEKMEGKHETDKKEGTSVS